VGRKKHDKLPGLDQLGARLRELRERAELSQMQLAERMGFDPTHGYKYVFRLEKGQVPNPTLRTITAYLESCGAGWADVTGLLPATTAAPEAEPKPERPVAKKGRKRSVEQPKPERRDTRPWHIRQREQLVAERARRVQDFWSRAERAERAVADALPGLNVPADQQRHYLAFVRPCCTIIDSYPAAQRRTVDHSISRLIAQRVEAGLDEKSLARVRDICLEAMKPTGDQSG
jgi:transcriptional regulator with XRE-family HTH domain